MKYKFQINKKITEAEIAYNSTFHSETTLKIDKEEFAMQVGDYTDEGVTSFFLNNKMYQIDISRDEKGYPNGIYVNGEYYSASLLKIDKLFYYKEKPVKTAKSGIVKSFIPGYIKKIFYNIDETVEEGDIVLIHEAMKMENEIRAPKSGTIRKLGVKEGDNILANHLLFEIE